MTGCLSICFANPFDVTKVRMQSLARDAGPGGQIPSALGVYKGIYANEGMKGFYRGIEANILRNALVNVGEMATYDQFK